MIYFWTPQTLLHHEKPLPPSHSRSCKPEALNPRILSNSGALDQADDALGILASARAVPAEAARSATLSVASPSSLGPFKARGGRDFSSWLCEVYSCRMELWFRFVRVSGEDLRVEPCPNPGFFPAVSRA